jgi:CheB methylesterase
VITVFLRSLTEHWDGQLIAVIVSGYDGDGAAALCGIKEIGGITIAQKLDTAGQPDMRRSAIAKGCIDLILSPEDIAQEIARIAHLRAECDHKRAVADLNIAARPRRRVCGRRSLSGPAQPRCAHDLPEAGISCGY